MPKKYVKVSQLQLDPKNSRKHGDRDLNPTADSLCQFGQQSPIVITRDKRVVKGNGTAMAAQLLQDRQNAAKLRDEPLPGDARLLEQDWTKLWYEYTDLEGDALTAYAIADNKTGMLAPFDMANVGEHLRTFETAGTLPDYAIGWDAAELRSMLDPPKRDDPGAKMDEADVLLEKWKVEPGDLWEIQGRHGVHRLICGDASDADTVSTLMAGSEAQLLITDPPYNVGYTGTTDRAPIANDDLGESFAVWLHAVLTIANMHLQAGCSFYVWYASSESFAVFSALANADMRVRQELIWRKNISVIGRQDYHWDHEPVAYGWNDGWLDEPAQTLPTSPDIKTTWGPSLAEAWRGYNDAHAPIVYGWKAGAAHRWFANRKQKTVLEFDRPHRSDAHPTMKPVPLIAYLIQNSSKPRETVLDLFLGSGTTMLAAETTGRICYGSELEPKYCAVTLDRLADAQCKPRKLT